MPKSKEKYPKSLRSDEIDNIATREFEHCLSPRWTRTLPGKDQGWDYMISIKENGDIKGKYFFAQIKGSDAAKYVLDNKYISKDLKVSTLNFLLSLNSPSMICVCDTKNPKRPIYWAWLQDLIPELEKEDRNWRIQTTVSLRILTSNLFVQDGRLHLEIEDRVKQFYNSIAISAEIGSLISDQLGLDKETFFLRSPDIDKTMSKIVYPHLYRMGVIGTAETGKKEVIKALSLKEQVILREIKEISSLLEALNDKEAEKRIAKLSNKIRQASKVIKAKYYNNAGILALHRNEKQKAKKIFTVAAALDPNMIKCAVNKLSVEYLIWFGSGKAKRYLPKDWSTRVTRILRKDRKNRQAIYLKALFMSETSSVERAIDFVRTSKVWGKNDMDECLFKGEIYQRHALFNELINLYEEIEKKPVKKDERFWAIYADAYFMRGIGVRTGGDPVCIVGPGPHDLSTYDLLKAEEYYKKAINIFRDKGFPRISEQTIANYSVNLSLLGKYQDSISICEEYVKYQPNSISVIENLVASLNSQNSLESGNKSVGLAKQMYRISPNAANIYNNLILALFCAEEYQDLVDTVLGRERKGFISEQEEGLSRSLLSISYNELGSYDQSDKQLQLLKAKPCHIIEAKLTEAEILHKRFRTKDGVALLRTALREINDERILAKLVRLLLPVNKNNATEIIEYLAGLAVLRQLTPDEYSILGKAYLELGMPDKASHTLLQAAKRYPEDKRFSYLAAIASFELGDEANAFDNLSKYLQKSEKRYDLLRNIAILAKNIGKLDESVRFLERALHLAADDEKKAEIHCLLYEIKKRLNKSPKDILYHANEYGRLIKMDVADEARYLMMFLLLSSVEKKEIDAELDSWIRDFQKRLAEFSKANPDYQALRTIDIPDGLSEEDQARYLLLQLAYISLPERLKIAPLQMAIESQPWPLAFRAQFLPGFCSIFEYWHHCTNSKEFANAIHVWQGSDDIKSEQLASNTKQVCIDINALLSLAEFDSLELLTKVFDSIIMARETSWCLDIEAISFSGLHPLAEKIRQWRLSNLSKIRVRSPKLPAQDYDENMVQTNLQIRAKKRVDEIIGSGVGASILLARDLNVPLYSDDSIIRQWAASNYGVNAFSTLGLISRLKSERTFSLEKETIVYSEMINKNFRTIPFQSEHLLSGLDLIVRERREKQLPSAKHSDLIHDRILGVLLKQFGETSLDSRVLAAIAIEWWIQVLRGRSEIRELISECMEYISFCLSQKTKSGVLKGIKKDEDIQNAALIWGIFWWRCNLIDCKLNNPAWSAIKETCKRVFNQSEKAQKSILFELIPRKIYRLIKTDTTIAKEDKLIKLNDLTAKCFNYGEPDKVELETAFSRLHLKDPL